MDLKKTQKHTSPARNKITVNIAGNFAGEGQKKCLKPTPTPSARASPRQASVRARKPFPAQPVACIATLSKWKAFRRNGSYPLSFVIQLVLFDLPVKRRQPDVEETGCLCLIATGVVEDALDM